jgi:hypothetical protein
MIIHPPNGRAYLVPRRRSDSGVDSTTWIYHCYLQFKELIQSKKWDDDLVFMWREDFNELYNNYHPENK